MIKRDCSNCKYVKIRSNKEPCLSCCNIEENDIWHNWEQDELA